MAKIPPKLNLVRLEIAEFMEHCDFLVDDDRASINDILKRLPYEPDQLERSAADQVALGIELAWSTVKVEELADNAKLALGRLVDREKDSDHHIDEKGKPLPQWRIESRIRVNEAYKKLDEEARKRAKLAKLLDKLTWPLKDRGELLKALIEKEQSRSSR